jgi:hypothetical protein
MSVNQILIFPQIALSICPPLHNLISWLPAPLNTDRGVLKNFSPFLIFHNNA